MGSLLSGQKHMDLMNGVKPMYFEIAYFEFCSFEHLLLT